VRTPVRLVVSPRTRAGLPFLLAPVTVSGVAIVGTLAGLSISAVIVVAAITAVLGALVAHRSVARLLSGSMLSVARPFAPGDRLRAYVPELGRVVEAELVRIGPLTTTLCTDTGVLVVPTGDLLRVPPA
jgi:small-conductance mechanosensitive channel